MKARDGFWAALAAAVVIAVMFGLYCYIHIKADKFKMERVRQKIETTEPSHPCYIRDDNAITREKKATFYNHQYSFNGTRWIPRCITKDNNWTDKFKEK